VKQASKIALVVLYFIASVALSAFLKMPEEVSIPSIAVPAVLFVLAGALLSAIAILPVEAYFAIPAIAIAALPFPFFMGFSIGSLFVSLGYFLGSLIFFFEVREEVSERVKLAIGKSIEPGLSALFAFFFIGIAAFAFFTLSDANARPEAMIPESVYGIATKVTSGYFTKLGCDVNGTLGACVGKIVSTEIARNVAESGKQCESVQPEYSADCYSQISSAIEAQVPEYTRQVRENLISQFDKEAKDSDTLMALLGRGMRAKAGEILAPFAKYVPIGGAVVAYSTLNILAFPAGILIKFIAAGIVSILLSIGAFEKKTVEIEAERIE